MATLSVCRSWECKQQWKASRSTIHPISSRPTFPSSCLIDQRLANPPCVSVLRRRGTGSRGGFIREEMPSDLSLTAVPRQEGVRGSQQKLIHTSKEEGVRGRRRAATASVGLHSLSHRMRNQSPTGSRVTADIEFVRSLDAEVCGELDLCWCVI